MKRVVATLLMVLAGSAVLAEPAGLHTLVLGHGPTVVLIHSLGSSRNAWMPTARKLMTNYRVVLVDLPGHGESAMPDPFTMDAGVAEIDQVLAAQKAESTVVVGQGMGGLMALLALSAHPERARGLVAIEVSLKKQSPVPEQQIETFLTFMDSNYEFVINRMYMSLARDSAQGVQLQAQAAQVPAANMKAYIRQMISYDPSDRAKKLKTPLLIVVTDRIWGAAKDSTTLASTMGYDAVPSYKLQHLKDCGIMVPTEQPDSLAGAISAFAHRVLPTK